MLEISYTSKFLKSYRKLPRNIQQTAAKKITIFQKEPFTPVLKTHKLSGNLEGLYAFSITYSHRILFQFTSDKSAVFINVGGHSIYE